MISVPIAINPDDLSEVIPKDAIPKKSYTCSSVACSTEVRLRRTYTKKNGTIVDAHFFHFADDANDCSWRHGESLEHYHMKMAIVDQINNGGFRVQHGLCCLTSTMIQGVAYPEHPVTVGGVRYRLDVGVVTTIGLLGIEVEHTHAVDERKAKAFAEIKMPWFEIPSYADIQDNHAPVVRCSTDPDDCSVCIERREAYQAEQRANRDKERALRLESSNKAWEEQRAHRTTYQHGSTIRGGRVVRYDLIAIADEILAGNSCVRETKNDAEVDLSDMWDTFKG